ncbi:TrmH family RNA methyltransferase [Microbulbifer thermotolerans]|uniref:TrmH family RNA methyltransferase n=1 Tax=Microbulbifer thermotolerans TaxID=252514 RepID=UPI002248EAB3|nr:TrmH family RNA methyltransferase [Microbulbifer thermotolerans]MCX2830635.1 hypothetical protein [Microbulbifer thermotolerans]
MKNVQLDHATHQNSGRKYPLCLLAYNIRVPTNIGSLFRIADALGVEKLFLSGGSICPPNTKIRRTSRAAEKYVPYAYHENTLDLVKQLKGEGYRIVCLEISSDSMDLANFSPRPDEKICLVLGSEKEGVGQELLDISDTTVHIPMLGNNSSMNVASACAIAAYHITQKLEPGCCH